MFSIFFIQIFNFQFSKRLIVGGPVSWDEKKQKTWADLAFREVKDEVFDVVYSRSYCIGSHLAALKYKEKNPESIWVAEFSDPISTIVTGEPHSVINKDLREKEPDFYLNLEKKVLSKADIIVFTNINQKRYMLGIHALADSEKFKILPHPVISSCFCDLIPTSYELDDKFINIAFFGSVYENRNLCFIKQIINNEKMLELKKEIKFHLFIPTWADFSGIFSDYESNKIIRNDYVSYFEFLNIAKKWII